MKGKLDTLPTFSVMSLRPFGAGAAASVLPMALHDFKGRSVVGAITLLTSLGWYALMTSGPMALILVCHGAGVVSLIPAWDAGRAAALTAMWGIMSCVMMLPCATVQIVDASRLRALKAGYEAALLFSLGYLCVVGATGVGGALVEWILESTGVLQGGAVIGDRLVRTVLVAVAGSAAGWELWRSSAPTGVPSVPCGGGTPLSQGLRHGWGRLGSCVAMICLQLAAGPMNTLWMVGIAIWMFASAVLGRGILLSSASLMALLGMAGLLLFGSLS